MGVRIFCAALALAAFGAQATAASPGVPREVSVRIGGEKRVVPVPSGMTVGSPELLSAEQSAAVPLGLRLASVLEGKSPPDQSAGAYLVLVETAADSEGRMSAARFAKVKTLARAKVSALAAAAAGGKGPAGDVPRVFLDEGDAFAWMVPASAPAGGTPVNVGTLYVLVQGRLLVLSLRTEQPEPAASAWIEGQARWFAAALRRANGR